MRTSLRNAKQASSANRIGRAMLRGMLRLAGAVPPLKRQFAKALG